jgi:GTP-binding protein Era
MNEEAKAALQDVDVIVWVIAGTRFLEDDEWVLGFLKNITIPVILVINKIDLLKDKDFLLPYIQDISLRYPFAAVFPISALSDHSFAPLEACLASYLPLCEAFYFPEHQQTDQTERFFIAEIVREKLMRFLGQELPYILAVEIERFQKKSETVMDIAAIIWVERDSQKAMVIGERGLRLKEIGTLARMDMEAYLDQKVFLRLWVKVRSGWSNDLRALKSLGYGKS